MKKAYLELALIVLVAGTALSSKPSQGPETAEEQLAAEDLLAKMRNAYATCHSYRDEGEVVTVFLRKESVRTVVKPFKTAFVRPDRFRFEFRDRAGEYEWDKYVVWSGASGVSSWWTLDGQVESHESLESALAGATGVSGGSAARVPGLLMPDMKWGRFVVESAHVLGKETVGGIPCWQVSISRQVPFAGQGYEQLANGSQCVLWIDTDAFLVRQVSTTSTHPGFSTETTTTYSPKVNVEISDTDLQFDPSSK